MPDPIEMACGMCSGTGVGEDPAKGACWQCDGTGTVLVQAPGGAQEPSEAAIEAALSEWFGRETKGLDYRVGHIRDAARMLRAAYEIDLGE